LQRGPLEIDQYFQRNQPQLPNLQLAGCIPTVNCFVLTWDRPAKAGTKRTKEPTMSDIAPEDPEVLAHAAEDADEEEEPLVCGFVYSSNNGNSGV
jgi:hypothetical protein